MSGEIALVATFPTEHDCARAIEELHSAHVHDFKAFMPFPSEEVLEASQEARGQGRSPVRLWVLLGGITGFLTAVAITIGTSLEWSLNVGGRAVASIPPYVVIMFELMILFGGVSGVMGFFVHGGLPVFDPDPGYRSRFAADKFGLVVRCSTEAEAAKLESVLAAAGAQAVEREEIEAAPIAAH
jgi:Protein of unknown function (DUF3341)